MGITIMCRGLQLFTITSEVLLEIAQGRADPPCLAMPCRAWPCIDTTRRLEGRAVGVLDETLYSMDAAHGASQAPALAVLRVSALACALALPLSNGVDKVASLRNN